MSANDREQPARTPASKEHPAKPADAPDVLSNAFERTDNGFAGRKDGERLIGRDIPIEVQDAEEEERES